MVKTNAKWNFQLRYTISVVLSSSNLKITVFKPNIWVQKRFATPMGYILATRGRPDGNCRQNEKKKFHAPARIRTHDLPPLRIYVKSMLPLLSPKICHFDYFSSFEFWIFGTSWCVKFSKIKILVSKIDSF